MSWTTAFERFGHRLFIAYIELKIEGPWEKVIQTFHKTSLETIDIHHEILKSQNGDTCIVKVIEPDGLRRMFRVTTGGTIALHQNILSYHPDQVDEITVDEKVQAGKDNTRHTLS
jgi:hypothetical protein